MSTKKERRSNQRERDEIAKRLKQCREQHAGHPAVLALIRVLDDILITYDYYQLIRHIIYYFDKLHNMLKTVRDKLKKKLGRIGFLLTNQTKISAFMTLVDSENFNNFYKEYATDQGLVDNRSLDMFRISNSVKYCHLFLIVIYDLTPFTLSEALRASAVVRAAADPVEPEASAKRAAVRVNYHYNKS